MGRIGWAVVAVLAMALIGVGFVAVMTLLREQPPEMAGTLARPAPGEVRPDYLADGTPVWVVALADGRVRVLSAFSTHTPAFVGKLLWWCTTAEAFDDPATGSRYDTQGVWFGGPGFTGLPAYEATAVGSQIRVGELGQAPPAGTDHSGPAEFERDWCLLPDDAADIRFHTFEGWPLNESPTEAVASAPDGWILVAGELNVDGDDVVMCAIDDCTDAVLAARVEANARRGQFSPLLGERFIARVRDGALVDVTRVVTLGP